MTPVTAQCVATKITASARKRTHPAVNNAPTGKGKRRQGTGSNVYESKLPAAGVANLS